MKNLFSILMMLCATFLLFGCNQKEVKTYEDCVASGYPVMESLPPKCSTPDGKVFTGPGSVVVAETQACKADDDCLLVNTNTQKICATVDSDQNLPEWEAVVKSNAKYTDNPSSCSDIPKIRRVAKCENNICTKILPSSDCCIECANAFSQSPVAASSAGVICGRFTSGKPISQSCSDYFNKYPIYVSQCYASAR